MTDYIESCFELLLEQIEPQDSDYNLYQNHLNSIAKRLHAVFSANKVELIGSFKRGTAISGSSDIDLMLVLSRSEVVWGDGWKLSNTILKNLSKQLRTRFWKTYTSIDKQAVTLRFSDGKHPVDVVPAIYDSNGGVKNYPIYAIPDGNGNWMSASPQAHNKFIRSYLKNSFSTK